MKKLLVMVLLLAGIGAAMPLPAQISGQWGLRRERLSAAGPVSGGTEYAYGDNALQTLDFYPAASGKRAPLVVFVHGGGWKRGDKGNATGAAKIAHFHAQGYAFASLNYRLVPGATVEQQATDVASAIAFLRKDATRLGFDPGRIVLMGHSAGAHLAALVGTDPRYLDAAGLGLSALSGVIALDGAAYDVPLQMEAGARFMQQTYAQAFGTDPRRQRDLSPTLHAGSPNVRQFLVLHVDREDGRRQSQALTKALRAGGTKATVEGFEGRGLIGHMAINRQLGEPGYPATPVVDAWLKSVFGN